MGFLNEDLNYVMDREYWFRLLLQNKKFQYIPKPLAKFRLIHGTKTYNENEKFRLEWLDILKKNRSKLNIDEKSFIILTNEIMAQYYFIKAIKSRLGVSTLKYFSKTFLLSKSYRLNFGFYKIILKKFLGIRHNKYERFKK